MMGRFDTAQSTKNVEPQTGTIGDELDRIEVKAGKIGMNSAEQAFSILYTLDDVVERLASIENDQSRKMAQTQFESITARLDREVSLFLRDLGGAAALRKERAQAAPGEDHWWWYLDQLLANRRKAALKRSLITIGAVLVGFLALAVIYQAFLAPDPEVAARYLHEQSARDQMLNGDLESALAETEKGLSANPSDPVFLIYRGVILDSLGRAEEAQQAFEQAARVSNSQEEFYVTRGTAYSDVRQNEKALSDAQAALSLNPDYTQAYLLSGQANEAMKKYQQAVADYDSAYAAAEKNKQYELAALARTRTAMLLQIVNMQFELPVEATATP